ncbi:MAG: tetratricopeptide repeat protein [Anaerolineae bacterium]|nr:tetratricopeptide repeat protein [Anaerolineae bacterium]
MRRVILCFLFCLAVLPWNSSGAQAQVSFDCEDPLIPNATPAYFLGQGNVFVEQGRYARAVEAYSCAIEGDPSYAPAYAQRAYAYAVMLDDQSALADYDQAIALNETLVDVYINRGALYTTLGNFGLAIGDFSLALALEPDNAAALNNRAVVHAIEGNYDLALADVNAAISAAPDYVASYATQAAIYTALANQSYQTFVDRGGAHARLPAGQPVNVMSAIDNSQRTGDFGIWLRLQVPAGQ